MELFDFINTIFNKPDHVYEDLNYGEKTKHVFMLNRFFSIKFPLQADLFNRMNTPPLGVIESWRLVCKSFKRTPGWIYTKTKKVQKEKKKNLNIDPDIIKKYLEMNSIGYREFEEALSYEEEKITKVLKSMEKAHNVFNKKK